MAPSDPDALIIGAGCAGIAAARALIAGGKTCAVLEAGPRVGGRAFTDRATLGLPVDLGATWLHLAEENPLTPFAEAFGLERLDHDTVRQRLLHLGDRFATDAELRAFEAADDAFEDAILRAVAERAEDASVADAMPRGGPWDATVAHWRGAQISAAEVERLSLRDYAASLLGGPNLRLRAGIGALVERLAEGLPIRRNAPVARLRWGGAGVEAAGAFGTLRARAAIVTVSTGVLAAGGIVFDPPLPARHREAIQALPLGLLTKVVFRAASADRLDIPPFAGLRRRVDGPGDRPVSWIGWPFGEPVLECFIGGTRA
ncbi:MAG TPA: FAD-dependent oxidoreductase, partial [Acetobacteraceae bacterium]|nr:FAD-dependent oxidoreductase [Acetobacteraceae bacterium]